MNENVLQTIRAGMDTFSKGQKRIAAFILDNYDRAAFMTAARLGETASVSESTVVRFAAQLGYDGYPEMQKALQELIRGKLTSIQRIQVSRDQMSGADILGSVMQRDMTCAAGCAPASRGAPKDRKRIRARGRGFSCFLRTKQQSESGCARKQKSGRWDIAI